LSLAFVELSQAKMCMSDFGT